MATARTGEPADRFAAFTAAVARRLPARLHRVVAPSLVGFALINSLTFALDLVVLSTARGALGWPLAVSVACGYAVAFAVGFVLNRVLNFRSHAAVGPQLARYAAVVAVNFAAIVLGVTTWLSSVGVDYRLARVVAGTCEVLYLYCALRWLVFRAADVDAGGVTAGRRTGRPPAPARRWCRARAGTSRRP